MSHDTSRCISMIRNLMLAIFMSLMLIHCVAIKKATEGGKKETAINPPTRPQVHDLPPIYDNLVGNCQNDFTCLLEALEEITARYGPRTSLDIFGLLKNDGLIHIAADDHHIAHKMGRITAQSFGVSRDAFLRCPTSLNNGCQHGFFEYSLGTLGTAQEVGIAICDSLDKSFSGKFIFYCFHGMGHGVLMAKSYNLPEALSLCDSLEPLRAREGCWQGVFMENVNAGIKGEARKGLFFESDPLAPCNVVEEKYRYQCFINHSGWLMKSFDNDLEKATSACLRAPSHYISPCLQSIGLIVTNPAWQPHLLILNNNTKFEDVAWSLCTRFPNGYVDQCVIGAIDNVLNIDELELARAEAFCNTVHPKFQDTCYRRIGISLRNQSTDAKVVREKCAAFEGDFAKECLQGASL